MKIITHIIEGRKIAEITTDQLLFRNIEEATDLVGNLYYQQIDKAIVLQKNIAPEFFDLKTGLAGEVLQKFTNYKIRLAIVGDFSTYTSKSLHDFILECNKGCHINFLNSTSEALTWKA